MLRALPLAAALVCAVGCKKEEKPRGSEAEAAESDRSEDDGEPMVEPLEPLPEEPAEQEPLGADPISLEAGLGATLDLVGDGLPAIRDDGRQIARAESRFLDDHDQPRLVLRIYDAASGRVLRELVILDPRRDRIDSDAAPPAAVARRLKTANRLLGRSSWRQMIEPLDVASDGWIRCGRGAQSFDVAGLTVSYGEPRLLVRRGDEVVLEKMVEAWVAAPKNGGCEPRGYVADAALDRVDGVLWLELLYCGDCGIDPRQVVVALPL